MKRFGEKLAYLRKRNGLTLRQLGEMLEVNHTHVSQLEHGLKPSIDLTIKIADIFNITLDSLMRDELEVD
jgi:transcriptional regulator with XRE-family HTH domain